MIHTSVQLFEFNAWHHHIEGAPRLLFLNSPLPKTSSFSVGAHKANFFLRPILPSLITEVSIKTGQWQCQNRTNKAISPHFVFDRHHRAVLIAKRPPEQVALLANEACNAPALEATLNRYPPPCASRSAPGLRKISCQPGLRDTPRPCLRSATGSRIRCRSSAAARGHSHPASSRSL